MLHVPPASESKQLWLLPETMPKRQKRSATYGDNAVGCSNYVRKYLFLKASYNLPKGSHLSLRQLRMERPSHLSLRHLWMRICYQRALTQPRPVRCWLHNMRGRDPKHPGRGGKCGLLAYVIIQGCSARLLNFPVIQLWE